MSNQWSMSDASRIQSSTARSGRDMSSRGFAARAQSAAARNDNARASGTTTTTPAPPPPTTLEGSGTRTPTTSTFSYQQSRLGPSIRLYMLYLQYAVGYHPWSFAS
ncbi:hypothetical protein TCE0_033f09181 [Talaromyces pinophilus]|uniref:Uncharacterized protein n=1 Tax=Talaromyces pinophilus TaxID=128442 RepID=A0A6V8HBW0_TALPI|nr:hypothetical protein TCE0_033f09181 [Talaromyces pinophilus]